MRIDIFKYHQRIALVQHLRFRLTLGDLTENAVLSHSETTSSSNTHPIGVSPLND
jgi:hypothetical protein